MEFAEEQIHLANHHRGQIIEKFVEKGDSWDKARQGYLLTLGMQTKATSMMANWIGGTIVNRDKKGDTNGRKPLEVVEAEKSARGAQFRAREHDVRRSVWFDARTARSHDFQFMARRRGFGDDPAWPVHDRIMSLQASALSQLMNPTTLRRVYDNEFRVPADEDALTIVRTDQFGHRRGLEGTG